MNPQEFEVDFGEVTTGGEVTGVSSVNGQTGDVVLNAGDVGALPDSTVIPTVNNGTLTIKKNGSVVNTFDANDSENKEADIEVPTQVSQLNNDSGYQTSANVDSKISTHNSSSTAHSAIRQLVTNEANARVGADNNLQGQIDAISASSDVKDIVGTYAELQAYDTSTLGNNDIIKVLQDENQSYETTYYRWSTTTETFTLIGEEGPYYTKSAADSAFVPQTRKVNNKALSSDITLAASDVSALSDSTKYGASIDTSGTTLTLKDQDGNTLDTATTQDTTYSAGANVTISASNEISATDTTYSAFTGTDGVSAGTSGLVPAPATTDAGKFLKSDGTWDTAGGGGGDSVYSPKTTSNNSEGGAVYIGNKDLSQVVQVDPTTTDQNYKYFWALPTGGSPNANSLIPKAGTLNILGHVESGNDYGVALGYNSELGLYTGASVALGFQAKAKGNASDGIAIGKNVNVSGEHGIGIGGGNITIASSSSNCVAIGYAASCYSPSCVALGKGAYPTRQGEVNVGCDNATAFNNTNYRVIGGVHDGQDAHDVMTVGQANALIDAINSALNTNIAHIGS